MILWSNAGCGELPARNGLSLRLPVVTVRGQLGRSTPQQVNPSYDVKDLRVPIVACHVGIFLAWWKKPLDPGLGKQRRSDSYRGTLIVCGWKNVDIRKLPERSGRRGPSVILLCNVMVQGSRTHL